MKTEPHRTVPSNASVQSLVPSQDNCSFADWLANEINGHSRIIYWQALDLADYPQTPQFERLESWLAQGLHGRLHYLENHKDIRKSIQKLEKGAHTLIMFSLTLPSIPTATLIAGESNLSALNSDALSQGSEQAVDKPKIARYAHGEDYHITMGRWFQQLAQQTAVDFPGEVLRGFTDSAPVLERAWAEVAGLGWQGKNTMLIHPALGSMFLLGGFVTSASGEYLNALNQKKPKIMPGKVRTLQQQTNDIEQKKYELCGNCIRCIDACPTGALAPWELNADRCISAATIEYSGDLPEAVQNKLQGYIFGCDICQDVCPWVQKHAKRQKNVHKNEPEIVAGQSDENPNLGRLDFPQYLSWDYQEWKQRLQPGGGLKRAIKDTPLMRAGRRKLWRNFVQAFPADQDPEAS